MTTLAPWTEQWPHFQAEIRDQFWGDLTPQTRQSWQDFLGRLSIEARDRYLGVHEYERRPERIDARNGFYERDFVTRLGTVRVRGGPHSPAGVSAIGPRSAGTAGGGGAAADP